MYHTKLQKTTSDTGATEINCVSNSKAFHNFLTYIQTYN